ELVHDGLIGSRDAAANGFFAGALGALPVRVDVSAGIDGAHLRAFREILHEPARGVFAVDPDVAASRATQPRPAPGRPGVGPRRLLRRLALLFHSNDALPTCASRTGATAHATSWPTRSVTGCLRSSSGDLRASAGSCQSTLSGSDRLRRSACGGTPRRPSCGP